jgi:hypothetical protein
MGDVIPIREPDALPDANVLNLAERRAALSRYAGQVSRKNMDQIDAAAVKAVQQHASKKGANDE